jgi:glycosyltransferase involved in cell wall biosynthesis
MARALGKFDLNRAKQELAVQIPSGPVMHVIPGLQVGGAERTLAALVTAFREQPVPQVVVDLMGGTNSGAALADAIRIAGVPVYQLGGQRLSDLPFVLTRLALLIRRLRPVAIQGWLYYADLTALWALELSGRRKMTRLYWGIRSSDMDHNQYRRALAWTIEQCAKRSARPDAVVANSVAGRLMHQTMGYRPRSFPLIPNGIDTQRFRPDPVARSRIRASIGIADDKPLILHVARVDPMKGHNSLIEVAKALPDVAFVLAGLGTERVEAPSNVTAIGVQNDMPSLYAAADLLLSTSTFGEGFQNVVAEAMACCVPVVATDVGDAQRIIGDTGAIVRPGDVTAMLSATQEILRGSRARNPWTNAARIRIVEHFSLDRMVQRFDALHFQNVLPDFEEADAVPISL